MRVKSQSEPFQLMELLRQKIENVWLLVSQDNI
jgi:hypothetical protein